MFLPALCPYTIPSPQISSSLTGLVCFCPDALEVLSFIKHVRRTAPRGLLHGDSLCLDCCLPRFPQSSFYLSVCSSSFPWGCPELLILKIKCLDTLLPCGPQISIPSSGIGTRLSVVCMLTTTESEAAGLL